MLTRPLRSTERHKPALGDVSRLLHRAKSGLSSTEDENDFDTNPLGLKPDPNIFVLFLKSIGDAEISSELFVKLLEGYRKDVMSEENEDPRWCGPTIHLCDLQYVDVLLGHY